MSKVSRSPERNTFQRDSYLKRCEADGKEPSVDYLKMWDDSNAADLEWEENEDLHQNDMEYDMRSSEYMCERVRVSDTYAQNLYAAMCNMRFQKREVLPILKDEYWSCTWRSAGGIVADMQGKGDYMNWYCSGMSHGDDDQEYETKRYVPEGTVTAEVANDLYDLGWVASEWPDDDKGI